MFCLSCECQGVLRESLGIFQVLMVNVNGEWVESPVQPMTPFFQGKYYCEELPGADVIVSFCRGQLLRKEGYWVELGKGFLSVGN